MKKLQYYCPKVGIQVVDLINTIMTESNPGNMQGNPGGGGKVTPVNNIPGRKLYV